MSSIFTSLKRTYDEMTSDVKAADLGRDTVVYSQPSDTITTNHGTRFDNTDTWLKVADKNGAGPALLEDQNALEKIHRFDHERIPERVVHARGTGAHGFFRVYDSSASKYTSAGVLTDPSRKTPVFVRFSTVQGSRGSSDTVRDVRGFAVKFYTQEGNWDIVGNDIPVFFIQDAMQFPDFVHAVKPEPHNEVPMGQSAHNNFWDFFGLQSQSAHMIAWVMSDRGIPRSFRMMQGFGVNTYTLINNKGERYFVKFHFTPELGVHSLMWDEALKISGQDPDFHRKDLEEAIQNGVPPMWKFGIQVLPESESKSWQSKFEFDILDATKIWPEDLVPVEYIGELVLDRTVDEFFPETEQVAFCTSHVVPGIGFSDDPLLQGRLFSYLDTQQSRLGTNWESLPINRPVCPVMNHSRDGQHRHTITRSKVNYWPNRFQSVPPATKEQLPYIEYPQQTIGAKQRIRGDKFQEHFSQATLFYNSLSRYEKAHMIKAMSFELDHCDDPIVIRNAIQQLDGIDHNLAIDVAKKIGADPPQKQSRDNHKRTAKGLSQLYFVSEEPTIKSRRIAILVAEGFDGVVVEGLRAALKVGGALPFVIGPTRGLIKASGSGGVQADHHFEGQRSTLFDALFIAPGAQSVETLAKDGRVIHWVREAFGHCKVIGAVGEGIALLRDAAALPGVYFAQIRSASDEVSVSYGVVTASSYGLSSAAADVLSIGSSEKGFVSQFAYEISKHRCWERETAELTDKVAF